MKNYFLGLCYKKSLTNGLTHFLKNIYKVGINKTFCDSKKTKVLNPMDKYLNTGLSIVHGNNYSVLKYSTLGEELELAAKTYSHNLALYSAHQKTKYTYEELNHFSDIVARCFIGLGIQMEEKIGVYAPNCNEWLFSQFATCKVGGIFININPAYQVSELEFTLNKTKISTLIMPKKLKKSNYVEIINSIDPGFKDKSQNRKNLKLKKLPYLKRVILLDDVSADEHVSKHHEEIGKH
jgi:fatty-acyl-CoA synthase